MKLKKTKKRKGHKLLIIIGTICVLTFAGGTGYVLNTIRQAPTVTKTKLSSVARSEILDADGNLIYAIGGNNRKYITYNEIPKTYVDALISTEDRTFWRNHGVNVKSTLGAFAKDIIHHGNEVAGGSTITQQLIKLSLYSTSNKDQTLKRKIQEAWLSYHLSQQIPKQKILEYYVNKIYEGHNVYGANTISYYYYNKPLSQLDLAQTAYIAGIGQSPTIYDLYTNPQACKQRRREVLLSMYDNDKITKDQFRQANNEYIMNGVVPANQAKVFGNLTANEKIDNSYIGSVVNQCNKLGINLSRGGYRIYTYLQPSVQKLLYDKLNNSPLFQPVSKIQGAGTIINPYTGGVLAQVGARNTNSTNPFDLNRATQNTRSNGSTIKPFTAYGPACEYLGLGSNNIVDDSPYNYAGTHIPVMDWDKQFWGKMNEKIALANSRNVPAVKLFEQVQPQRVFNFLVSNGFTTGNLENFDASKSIGLDTSTYELANGYGTIANGGIYHKPSYIKNIVDEADNSNLNLGLNQQHRAMKQSTSYILFNMLQAVYTNPKGTAYSIADKPNYQIAGKPGTVDLPNSNPLHNVAISDAWSVSCVHGNPEQKLGYSLALWIGYDNLNGKDGYMTDKQGTDIPLQLNNQIMNQLVKEQNFQNYNPPASVKEVSGGGDSANNLFVPINASHNLIPVPKRNGNAVNNWYQVKGGD